MTEHCCEMMRYNVEYTCDVHVDRFGCPDCLVNYDPSERIYGLIIHDGGESVVAISHCPGCGAKLP
jgi:hypothetical protein